MKLKNKIALVTGGSNGIGKSISKKFLNEGADLIVFDKKEPSYDAEYFDVDIRDEKEIEISLEKIDRLDILVNNAGVYQHTPIDNFDDTSFYKIFETNVKGYRMMYTYCMPLLQDSKDGNVINIASGLAYNPEPYSDLYSASKAAINSMKTSWSNSYKDTEIRANSILPNPVNTDMLTENFSKKDLDEYRELQPMRKFSQPEDVAEVAILLASNDSFNGAEVEIGGEAHNNQYGL